MVPMMPTVDSPPARPFCLIVGYPAADSRIGLMSAGFFFLFLKTVDLRVSGDRGDSGVRSHDLEEETQPGSTSKVGRSAVTPAE